MCGITGIFSYHAEAPKIDKEELITIRDKMVSRGPDGKGVWYSANQRVGLAHRRLSIIDLSEKGAQPMVSADNQHVVSFNGEIYNHRDLREKLKLKGYVFHSDSDTEVLLHLYAEKGGSMVDDLRGMFTFAIWDNVKQGLLLARDTFGIKPLYISDDGKTLRFASQVKALLSGAIDQTPNEAGHVGFFLWGHIPEPHTLYKNIDAFPPGVVRWISKEGQVTDRKFAYLPELIKEAEEKSQYWNARKIHDYFQAAVEDSIQQHLVADVPIGIFLSSGIDSCALASLATDASTSPIHTLTMGFEAFRGKKQDETKLAEQMAKQLNSNHQTHWVTQESFKSTYNQFLDDMDQPSIDGFNTWLVCKAAKEAGLKVAISGLGGDELLGGYPSFQQIPSIVNKLKYVQGLNPWLGKTLRQVSSPWIKKITSPKYASLVEYGGTEAGAYFLRRGLFMPWELDSFLPRELIDKGLERIMSDLHEHQPSHRLSSKGKVSSLESTLYMRNQLLRDSDWASMGHSIELRVPLVDIEVLAVASRASKSSLGNVPRKSLPSAIVNQKKLGFTTPISQWAQEASLSAEEHGLKGWAKFLYKEIQVNVEG